MVLILTLVDIANGTIFSDRIPEAASLMVFAAALIASAVTLRKVLARRDDRSAARAENQLEADLFNFWQETKKMSVEFRQRTIGEFIGMLKRRKWMILLPTLTVTLAIGYVVYKLPSLYESTTLLTVKPPTISTNLVQSLTNEDLSQRLQTMNQEVLSRSVLEPMVTKYDLYKPERESGMPMELIIDKMYKAIKVELDETGNEKVAAFRIRYRDREPQATRNVTAELASRYVNSQIATSTEIAESTRELFGNQLNEKKKALDELEKQRLDIMMQNVATLPESEQGLVAQLQGLRQREESIIKEKETLSNEKGRLNDSIRALNSQMRLIEDFGEKETQEVAKNTSTIEDTPAYAQLISKRADLSAKLEKLKAQYREKHPEVVDTKIQIDKVNEEITNLGKNSDKRVQTLPGQARGKRICKSRTL